MRLEFLPRAEQDLETIGDYIALDNPGRAGSVQIQTNSGSGSSATPKRADTAS